MTNTYDSARRGLGALVGIAVAFVVIVAVVLIGWNVGWWFRTQNTNREAHLYEHGYAKQSTLIEEIGSKQSVLTEIDVQLGYASVNADPQQTAALKAQRLSVANIICADAAQLNGNYDGLNTDQIRFVTINCDGATVASDSSLRS